MATVRMLLVLLAPGALMAPLAGSGGAGGSGACAGDGVAVRSPGGDAGTGVGGVLPLVVLSVQVVAMPALVR
eukprot:4845138-Alexandrium_andersonii.AAC.1